MKMVQKGDKENTNELINDLKEEHNLNNESINSTLNFSSIYLNYNKSPLEINSNNYLDVNDNDDWNYSDNVVSQANSNCSSNSSTSGNLVRNVNLDDVEFDLEQFDNKSDLIIKVKLKKLKVNKFNHEKMNSKSICLEIEDFNGATYLLKIKPLHDSIKDILNIELKDKDYIEISCVKELPIKWPCLIEKKELLSNYVMDKFNVPFKQDDIVKGYEVDDQFQPYEDNLNFPSTTFESQSLNHYLSISNRERRDLRSQNLNENKWRLLTPYNSNLPNTNRDLVGYTGLDNIGNTCFMNAVIQCLSNTEELRDFFLDNNFNDCINRQNPFGSNGHVAIGFYQIVVHLWSGKHQSFSPEKFKDFISTKMNKFSDNAQEDSVEFMEVFLDLLHEDLNRVDRSKKIVVDPLSKPEDEMNDDELSNAMWSRHLKYNDSLIVDLFHGQLKSHLSCTVCKKSSITLDPFLFLPVPLPKPQITYTVFYFSLDYSKKPLKVSVTCSQDVKCNALLQSISDKFKVNISNLRLLACNRSKEKLIDIDEQINNYENNDLFIFQVKEEKEYGERVYNFLIKQYRLSTSKNYLEFETCDSNYWSLNDWLPDQSQSPTKYYKLGRPFIISLTRSELNYKNLCTVLKNRSRHSVDINIFEINIDDHHKKTDNEIVGSNSNTTSNNEESNVESFEDPLNDSTIEIKVKPFMLGRKEVRSVRKIETLAETNLDNNFNIIHMIGNDLSNPTDRKILNEETDFDSFLESISTNKSQLLNLLIQWKDDKDSNYRLRINSKDLDHSANYFELLNQISERSTTTLEDCLKIFTDTEELSLEDCWHCPTCKKPQKALKQLTIWRLPKILIIQLKRFSYKQFTRDKIDHFIEFPINNLDLKDFCSESKANLEGKAIYDLYGVINHFGGILGGHYTCCTKTVYKNNQYGWRTFDDSNVDDIDESSIVTSNAYILFYRLRLRKNSNGMETE